MEHEDRAEIDELNAHSWRVAPAHPARALELAQQAEVRSRECRYFAGEATSRLNAGWACIYLGRLDDALTLIYQAREFFEATGDLVLLSESINGLGVVAKRLSEYDLALDQLQHALEIAIEVESPTRRVAALNNLGELHKKRDDLDEAARFFESAGVLAAEHDLPGARAVICCNQARVLLERGELPQCQVKLDSALDLALDQDDRATEAEVLRLMANLQRARGSEGDQEVAEELYMQSIAIAHDAGMPDAALSGVFRLASLCFDQGRVEEAAQHAEAAAAIVNTAKHLRVIAPLLRRISDELDTQGDGSAALSVLRLLDGLRSRIDSAEVGRRARTLRHYYYLEQAHREAEAVRQRNEELQGQWESLTSENSMLHLLYTIGSEITASLDMDELSQRLYVRVNETMPADVFGIAAYNEENRELQFTHVVEQNQQLTPFNVPVDSPTSFGAAVIRGGQAVFLNDANRDYSRYVSTRKPFASGDSQSLIFLPLRIEERIIGLLTVQSYRKNAYTSEHIDFLRMLAPYLSIAMDNSGKMETIVALNTSINREKKALEEAYEQINHLANHDTLTMLANRRLVTELVNEHISLAQRQNARFGLLYLDLDKFKPINDVHGHSVGDKVLVEISRRLQRTVRQSDSVARLGGDEFLVVVRDIANEDAIVRIAEKVRNAVHEPVLLDGLEFKVTVSIGVSVFPRHGTTFDELVTVADRAMYKSKQAENRFVSLG